MGTARGGWQGAQPHPGPCFFTIFSPFSHRFLTILLTSDTHGVLAAPKETRGTPKPPSRAMGAAQHAAGHPGTPAPHTARARGWDPGVPGTGMGDTGGDGSERGRGRLRDRGCRGRQTGTRGGEGPGGTGQGEPCRAGPGQAEPCRATRCRCGPAAGAAPGRSHGAGAGAGAGAVGARLLPCPTAPLPRRASRGGSEDPAPDARVPAERSEGWGRAGTKPRVPEPAPTATRGRDGTGRDGVTSPARSCAGTRGQPRSLQPARRKARLSLGRAPWAPLCVCNRAAIATGATYIQRGVGLVPRPPLRCFIFTPISRAVPALVIFITVKN